MHKLVMLPALLLAACATAPAPPPPAQGGVCRDEGLSSFVGREATSATLAELQRASGAKTMRVVQPGMAVTMDFSPERLTVQIAPGNKIERANCG